MTDIHDVIAAFADGERVSPASLKTALADEAGREYLVELLALRDLVHSADPLIEVNVAPRRRWPVWSGIAAAIAVSIIGGYAAGRVSAPAPRVAPATFSAVDPVQRLGPAPAPQPTRVIHLEPGVDWKETVGG